MSAFTHEWVHDRFSRWQTTLPRVLDGVLVLVIAGVAIHYLRAAPWFAGSGFGSKSPLVAVTLLASLVLIPVVAALALVLLAVPLGILLPWTKGGLRAMEEHAANATDLDDHMHIPEVNPQCIREDPEGPEGEDEGRIEPLRAAPDSRRDDDQMSDPRA
jgi:hypothetical protein